MADQNEPQTCEACKVGKVVGKSQEISFQQWTDRGYVLCQVTILTAVCDHCGSRSWDEDTEAIIEAAIQQEYDKLR